jgi:hypothetical protein
MRSLELVATLTLTFFFPNVEGSAAMVRLLGDAYAAGLADHHQLIRPGLVTYGG